MISRTPQVNEQKWLFISSVIPSVYCSARRTKGKKTEERRHSNAVWGMMLHGTKGQKNSTEHLSYVFFHLLLSLLQSRIKSWRTSEGYIVFNCSLCFPVWKEEIKLAISKFSTNRRKWLFTRCARYLQNSLILGDSRSKFLHRLEKQLDIVTSLQSSPALHSQIGEGQEDSWEQHGLMKENL